MAQTSYGYFAIGREAMRGTPDNFDNSNLHIKVHTTESAPLYQVDHPRKQREVKRRSADQIEMMEYYKRASEFGMITPNEVRERMGRGDISYGIDDAKIERRVLCAYCGGPPRDANFCKSCGGPQKESR